ncbi:MAG: hypothetical protein AB1765_11735 [Candidatus Hydrogenedentota bacterium]
MRLFFILCVVVCLGIILPGDLWADTWAHDYPKGKVDAFVGDGPDSDWGDFYKAIVGDDGNKNLAWNLPTSAADTFVFIPNGDGTWSCTFYYSPGYMINQIALLWSATGGVWSWSTSYDSGSTSGRWWSDHDITNYTIPSNATGSWVVMINWVDNPWSLGTSNMLINPDSGRIFVNWQIQGTPDVDAAIAGANYGYKLFRCHDWDGDNNPDEGFSVIPEDTYLSMYNSLVSKVTISGNNYIRYIDNDETYTQAGIQSLTNNDTYFYYVYVKDAYDTWDTSVIVSEVPAGYIPVIFKVENEEIKWYDIKWYIEGADWSVIQKQDGKAYVTPYYKGKRIPGIKHEVKVFAVSPRET